MSSELLPPIPKQPMDPSRPDSVAMWKRQFFDPLFRILGKSSGLVWSSISKAGSSLKDLEMRKHSDLQDVAGWNSGTDTTQDQHISPLNGKKWEDHANANGVKHHGLDHDERYALKEELNSVPAAEKLATARQINGVDFDGTADISVPLASAPDYAAAVWMPVFTAATPGDLAVTYTQQTGTYTKLGDRVTLDFNVNFTATWTTASGLVRITGIPFLSANIVGNYGHGALYFTGINKAGYSQIIARVNNNQQFITLPCSGMGVGGANLAISDLVSGAAMQLTGSVTYKAAA